MLPVKTYLRLPILIVNTDYNYLGFTDLIFFGNINNDKLGTYSGIIVS